MDNGIFIIAHSPLASALRQGLAHVFPEAASQVLVLDVQAQDAAEVSFERGQSILAQRPPSSVLYLTDMLGATPSNVALRLAQQAPAGQAGLVTGVNMPMLLRAVTYQGAGLTELIQKVMAGGVQGIVDVPLSYPSENTEGKR